MVWLKYRLFASVDLPQAHPLDGDDTLRDALAQRARPLVFVLVEVAVGGGHAMHAVASEEKIKMRIIVL